MKIPAKNKKPKLSVLKLSAAIALFAVAIMGWRDFSPKQGSMQVNFDDLLVAKVERGELIRQVHGAGSLLPISANFIAASSSGRIKEILRHPSDQVSAGDVIMILENPELQQAVDDMKFEVELLKAQYHSLEQRWRQNKLRQEIVVADFETRFEVAKLKRIANEELLATKAVSDIDHRESLLQEQQLEFQHGLEVQLLQGMPSLEQAELTSAQARLNKAQRQLTLQENLANELYVKATANGVLQDVAFQVGEPIQRGTVLARISEKDRLKAELRIQESQIKHVLNGQNVTLRAGNQSTEGKVIRINPAVKDGVVKVDVKITGDMFSGARTDLRIEGMIELEQLDNVLYVKRPVFSQEFTTNSVFLLNQEGTSAKRQLVKFGRGSMDMIEILTTLPVGTQMVVSSTKKYDTLNELSLRN